MFMGASTSVRTLFLEFECQQIFPTLFANCSKCCCWAFIPVKQMVTYYACFNLSALSSNFRIHFRILAFTFKVLYNQSPQYISDFLCIRLVSRLGVTVLFRRQPTKLQNSFFEICGILQKAAENRSCQAGFHIHVSFYVLIVVLYLIPLVYFIWCLI